MDPVSTDALAAALYPLLFGDGPRPRLLPRRRRLIRLAHRPDRRYRLGYRIGYPWLRCSS